MPELLPNPSFDAGAAGWAAGAQFTLTAPDATHVQAGANAAKCTGVASAAGTWRILAAATAVQPALGSCRVSAWVYIPAAWASGNVFIEVYDLTLGGNVGTLAQQGANMGVRDQFQQVVCDGAYDASPSQGIRISTVGTVVAGDLIWVDSASVTQGNALMQRFRRQLRKRGR